MNQFIERENAESDLLQCAAFVAERIGSADAHATSVSDAARRFAAKGELDLAAGLADSIGDPHQRDTVLSEIAAFCVEFNDDEYGFQLVEAIEEANVQQHALHNIAVHQAAQQRFDDALETIKQIDDSAITIGDLAVRAAFANNEPLARRLLAQIDLPSVRAQVLLGIAQAKSETDESPQTVLNESLTEIESVEFNTEKTQLLLDVAAKFLNANDIETAQQILIKTELLAETLEPNFRAPALAQIAALFARSKDFASGERILSAIESLQQTAIARISFADEFYKADATDRAVSNLEEALVLLKTQIARFIDSRSNAQFDLWATIAVRFAQFGKFERSLEVALEIPHEAAQAAALTNLAVIFQTGGREELARQALTDFQTVSDRVFALLAVSRNAARNGDSEKSLVLLNEAFESSEDIEQLNLRSEALSEIVEQFAARGETAKATEVLAENLRIVAAINNKSQQVALLADIGATVEKAGLELTDQMRGTLNTIVRKSLI